jgi:rhodanese-related sulfurtransferase
VTEISVFELKRRRDAGEPLVLLDVREPDELVLAAVDGITAIPMAAIPTRLGELPSDVPVVVMCHSGGRSARVTAYLNQNGYTNAVNLTGGIDAWSDFIDPTVPHY